MKFWHANRLDQEKDHDPAAVARQFIAAVRDGYDLSSCRLSLDFAIRWWLTDPKAFNASWDEKDWDQLTAAFDQELSPDDLDFIWDRLEGKQEAPTA